MLEWVFHREDRRGCFLCEGAYVNGLHIYSRSNIHTALRSQWLCGKKVETFRRNVSILR